jgi:hypothetical protein
MVDINELYKRANKTSGNDVPSPFTPDTLSPKMTVSRISDELSTQTGRSVDLGFGGNYLHKRHVRALNRDVMKKISTEQADQIMAVKLEALKANVELIREEMRINWSREYAALGEQALVSEMTSIRKFEAVFDTGRELLYGDRGEALERLENRYKAGLLTDVDYEFELSNIFNRYRQLLDEFTQIVNERGINVRTAFRTPKK